MKFDKPGDVAGREALAPTAQMAARSRRASWSARSPGAAEGHDRKDA